MTSKEQQQAQRQPNRAHQPYWAVDEYTGQPVQVEAFDVGTPEYRYSPQLNVSGMLGVTFHPTQQAAIDAELLRINQQRQALDKREAQLRGQP